MLIVILSWLDIIGLVKGSISKIGRAFRPLRLANRIPSVREMMEVRQKAFSQILNKNQLTNLMLKAGPSCNAASDGLCRAALGYLPYHIRRHWNWHVRRALVSMLV